MVISDVLKNLKNKVLDAATYELLRRNFELLEENNAQLKDKIKFQQESIENLESKNFLLTKKCSELQVELDKLHREDEFVMYQGLAFKKNANGGVDDQPYCPNCHKLLSTMDNSIFICNSCDYTTSVFKHPVDIAKKLNVHT